jgi:hypothetical protein
MQPAPQRAARAFGNAPAGVVTERHRSGIAVTEDRKTRTKTAKMGQICRYLAEQILIRHDPCK